MRPGGRIGSLALSLNQSPQIFFALFFYFLALFLDPFFLLLHTAILSFSASCYDFFCNSFDPGRSLSIKMSRLVTFGWLYF